MSDGWTTRRTKGVNVYGHPSHKPHRILMWIPQNPVIHTHNIERLRQNVKEWSTRPVNGQEFYKQYLAWCPFLHHYKPEVVHHLFFVDVVRLSSGVRQGTPFLPAMTPEAPSDPQRGPRSTQWPRSEDPDDPSDPQRGPRRPQWPRGLARLDFKGLGGGVW